MSPPPANDARVKTVKWLDIASVAHSDLPLSTKGKSYTNRVWILGQMKEMGLMTTLGEEACNRDGMLILDDRI